jgi:TPR repeat protein
MRRLAAICALTLLAGLAPVRASETENPPTFSRNLDTLYDCLVMPKPTPACEKGVAQGPPLELDKPPPPPPPPPPPSAANIAPRVTAGKPSPADLKWLHKQVGLSMPVELGRLLLPLADSPRETGAAAQLLAWCYFKGLGVPESVTMAYALYRLAGDLGVPTARDNQVALFRNAAPETRNKILMLENMQRVETPPLASK